MGEGATILATTDGGGNWNQLTSGTTDWLGGVWFMGSETGWTVAGSNDTATILNTINAGSSWEYQAAGTDTLLRNVHFTDLAGRLVMTPLDEPLQLGTHSVVVNAEGLDQGVYICRVRAGSAVASERFVLLR